MTHPTCLLNSVFEINAIEIHWVKNTCHINIYIFTQVLMVSVNSEGKLELKYLIQQWICLFVESKNIFVLFLYHEVNMSYVCLFTLQ